MKQANSSFRRPSKHRPMLPKVLIACEGSATEPGYFNGIKKDAQLATAHIYVLRHPGTDPPRIVQAAIDGREEHRRETGGWRKGDQAWAVLDGDEHIARDEKAWKKALALAQAEQIELAISNPAFELWYLMHFQDHGASLSADQAKARLRKHLPDYDKAQSLYPQLKPRTREAIERSDQLEHRRVLNGYGEHANPTTGVRVLVRRLLNL